MINLSQGISYDDYLRKTAEEQRKALMEMYDKTELSEKSREIIKGIKEVVNVVVYSEGYCPDCTVTLPFIKRIEELNSNIKVYVHGMKGNEELLREYTGTARIPTVMTFTEAMEPIGAYIEIPKVLREKTSIMKAEDQKEVIREYRKGRYNNLIEEELVNIIK